ncbi:MAG TPA: class I SAM-dependent methyltransferase [Verrucomicrobiae bacterium]|jgi:methyltransferase (TIGR00027 family)|nr:class I SAM-dependent methyltransferase [Verrucomicrobiae bacterium]
MQQGQPSRTALSAAAHRAAHQILEQGRIFADPLAVRVLGQDVETIVREATERPTNLRMRLFIALRTRVAEDALAAAVERGASQLVVLGAGLDTFAYRSPFGERLRIFEVDHPDTQEWKRRRLQAAAIPIPNHLTFAPIDFERQTLADGLASAGFDPKRQTFFAWLGVVPYLTQDAIWSTLGFIANLPGGAHVVFDYSDPPESLSAEVRAFHDTHAARTQAVGELWISYFEAASLRSKLISIGFREVEDLGPPQILARLAPGREGAVPEKGGHILRATTMPPA